MLLESLLTYYLIVTTPVLNDRTVDLRKGFPPVFDQGYSNSCTANAITSVAFFHEKKGNKNSKLISRSDLYHQSTIHKHKDKGASLKRSMDVLSNEGLCDEKFWPYHWKNVLSDPPDICVRNRKQHSTQTFQYTVEFQMHRVCRTYQPPCGHRNSSDTVFL